MKFKTIVIDPPWRYKNTLVVTGNAEGRKRQTGRSGTTYPTMDVEQSRVYIVLAMLLAALAFWLNKSSQKNISP